MASPLAPSSTKRRNTGMKSFLRAGMHDMSLKPESLSCSQQMSSFDFASRTTRIEENTDYFLWSEKVRKDFQPFWANLNGDIADAGQVASGPAETVD